MQLKCTRCRRMLDIEKFTLGSSRRIRSRCEECRDSQYLKLGYKSKGNLTFRGSREEYQKLLWAARRRKMTMIEYILHLHKKETEKG
jgi:hypothetical protein